MNSNDQALFDKVISKLKTDIQNPVYKDYDRKFNSFNYKNTGNAAMPECEAVAKAYFDREKHLKVVYRHGESGSPEYSQSTDTLAVYPLSNCQCSQMYYSVLFHEITHSTGAIARLNREGFDPMDDYEIDVFEALGGTAKEELIAEISSTFFCEKLGIDSPDVYSAHVSYIKGWKDGEHITDKQFDNCVEEVKRAIMYILEGTK